MIDAHSRPIKRIADSRSATSVLMGPQDANVLGNVHGGVIMKMVDEAGALVAIRHANLLCVTVAIDSMTFMESIRVGNLVTCKGELTYVGRTSMEVRVAVIAEDLLTGASKVTNSAYLVYVALDLHGNKSVVPELLYETREEQLRAEQARERQAFRKQQREREKHFTQEMIPIP
ncbi:MAG: hotdog domain-containing protein [Chloroflexota bacterium]|nr:hotdog domain-containing protein [Chloroflexota bacterium]